MLLFFCIFRHWLLFCRRFFDFSFVCLVILHLSARRRCRFSFISFVFCPRSCSVLRPRSLHRPRPTKAVASVCSCTTASSCCTSGLLIGFVLCSSVRVSISNKHAEILRNQMPNFCRVCRGLLQAAREQGRSQDILECPQKMASELDQGICI